MTLYVTNLVAKVTPDDLIRLFAPFGRVVGAEVWAGHNGKAGQLAGVIDMHDGGGTAIAAVDGQKYRGRTLAVGVARPWDPA